MTAKAFRVSGRVQGVGFRWSAQEEARPRGLSGWVKNEADGTVSGFVQGDAAALEPFLDWLRVGPRSAKVSRVELVDAEPAPLLRLFTVR